MPPRLRLITGLAIAQLAAAAILIATRDFPLHLPVVPVYLVNKQLATMSVPVLIASVVLLVVAMSYLLAGALHAHWIVRLVVLGGYTFLAYDKRGSVEGQPLYDDAFLAALVLIWMVGLASWVYDRRAGSQGYGHRAHHSRIVPITFLVVIALTGVLYGLPFLANRDRALLLATVSFTTQLGTLSALLVPILIVAGIDFADWADFSGKWAARHARRLRHVPLLATVTAVVALAAAGQQVWQFRHGEWFLLEEIGFGVAAAGLIGGFLWLVRGSIRDWSQQVPYAVLFCSAVLGYAATGLFVLVSILNAAPARAEQSGAITANLTRYSHSTTPEFSLEQPAFWDVTVLVDQPGLTRVHFDGLHSGNPAFFEVVALPAPQVPDSSSTVTSVLSAFTATNGVLSGYTAYLESAKTEGPWEVFEVKTIANGAKPGNQLPVARLWTKTEDAQAWVLVGYTFENLFSANEAAFNTMASTWEAKAGAESAVAAEPAPPESTGPGASETASSGDPLVNSARAVEVGLFVLLTAIAVFALRTRLGRRHASVWGTAALFVTIVAVLKLTNAPDGLLRVAGYRSGFKPMGLHLEGIQALVAIASLAWLAWCALRGRNHQLGADGITLVLSLNVGLQALSWLHELYNKESEAGGRFSVFQALILLLCLAWDVAMSGESFTNQGNRWFPRHSRVPVFMGYVMLGVVLILYFSSLQFQASSAAVQPQFESEPWPQSGLIGYGIPLLLTLFIMEVARRRAPPPNTPSAGEHSTAAIVAE